MLKQELISKGWIKEVGRVVRERRPNQVQCQAEPLGGGVCLTLLESSTESVTPQRGIHLRQGARAFLPLHLSVTGPASREYKLCAQRVVPRSPWVSL